jgi:predicted amidophosphoribosyltransferase
MSELTKCTACGESVSNNEAICPCCGKPVKLSPNTNSRHHVVLDRLADEYRKGRLTDTNLRALWQIAKQFMKDPVCV